MYYSNVLPFLNYKKEARSKTERPLFHYPLNGLSGLI
jgi:hypothetical protein